tara:strand:- start:181 stop:477 length:297 start_codon:yes stop_codon:yes gene_type:complete
LRLKTSTNFDCSFEIDRITQEVRAGNMGQGVQYSDATKNAFKSSGGYKIMKKILKLGAAVAGGEDQFENCFVDHVLGKDKKKAIRNYTLNFNSLLVMQ